MHKPVSCSNVCLSKVFAEEEANSVQFLLIFLG
jgi:hypothetical protein